MWELERRLEAIALDHDRVEDTPPEEPRDRPSRSVITVRSKAPQDRDYWLTRCDGFAVEAPASRHLGVVEGIRFGSRIDRPEQREAAVGRVRQQLLLVPVDEVESVSGDQQLIVLNRDAVARHDRAHILLAKAPKKPQPSTP